MNPGILFALGCYGLWGVLPVYWKALQAVPSTQILAHRMVWSLFFVGLFFLLRRDLSWLRKLLERPRDLLLLLAASVLISLNWWIYIWAVNSGQVIETSLGYFMNPLVNFLLGVIIFRERPGLWQWLAIGLAAIGVLVLTIDGGRLPWIALSLAMTFATYGVIKKVVRLKSMKGLFVETAFFLLPGLAYLWWQDSAGLGAFTNHGWTNDLLLVFSGLVTALPLFLFARAAQLLPFSTLGFFQYLAPIVQFLLGYFVFQEAFGRAQLIGYAFIWLALLVFSFEGILRYRLRLAAER